MTSPRSEDLVEPSGSPTSELSAEDQKLVEEVGDRLVRLIARGTLAPAYDYGPSLRLSDDVSIFWHANGSIMVRVLKAGIGRQIAYAEDREGKVTDTCVPLLGRALEAMRAQMVLDDLSSI